MGKFLLVLLSLCFSATVFASGKLSIQGNWYEEGKAVRPIFGLSVYEKLMKNAYLNAWTGYGTQFLETDDDVNWYVAKAQIDLRFKKLTVAPGVMYKFLPNEKFEDVIPYLRADYQLW